MTAGSEKKCRVCEAKLIPVIDFGKMPLANAFLTPHEFPREYFFQLTAALCEACSMFQLLEQPEPKQMFHSQYPFFTASSKKMVEHFQAMADQVKSFIKTGGRVLEIGSNDGTLLANFNAGGFDCLGVEPSANVAAKAVQRGIRTKIDFFNQNTAAEIQKEWGKADAVIAANCLCHIPEPAEFFKGLDLILASGGIAVFEDPYLGDVLEKTAYDQIYDEHVFLFSVTSMSRMLERFGFEIFDLEPQWTHGGSMRYWVCRKGARGGNSKAADWLRKEEGLGINRAEIYQKFKDKCEQSKQKLVRILKEFKSKGQRVVGYAATSKSTTVLNYCGIGPDLIEGIVDTTPEKQGKFTPGSHIPVFGHESFSQKYPDAAVLFAWNHAKEIFEKENDFQRSGGFWIEFVPEVNVLGGSLGA